MERDQMEILRHWGANGALFGVVTLGGVKDGLSVVLLLLSIGWTLHKIYRSAQD